MAWEPSALREVLFLGSQGALRGLLLWILGVREEEKVGGDEEAPGRSTQCPATPSPVAVPSPALGSILGELPCCFFQRAFWYPHQLCMTDTSVSPQSLCLGLCVCDHAAAALEVGPWEGAFLVPQPWVGRGPGYRTVLSPPPGLTTSVTPSILRKVLRESLPLLETWADRGGEG